MKRLKIVLIGAGSLYFEHVMSEIAITPELEGSKFMMYDIDVKRMNLMEKIGNQILKQTGANLTIESSLELEKALDGADFAISSIGVHGPGAQWHKIDSDTAAKFGIIHTTGDTIGPGGLSQGLRIIPIYIDIARRMEKYCPDVILLNHSNPMAAVCRAVSKYTSIHVIGYCHNVAGGVRYFSKVLDIEPEELDITAAGVNHMLWLLGITHHGKDMYPELKKRLSKKRPPKTQKFAQELFELTGLYPIGGDRHMVEFFPHSRRATKTKKIPYGLMWRSKMIEDAVLAREISTAPEEIELKASGKKPISIPEKPSPENMGLQVKSMSFGPEKIHYVNTPNRGAIPNLPSWAIVELKGVVGVGGARSVYVGELPPQIARWTLSHIYTHELMVDAAVEGSRQKALMALSGDPMIRDFKEAEKILDAIVKAQGDRLKRFK